MILSAAGFVAVAKIAQLALARLGLDHWKVAVWFGLADEPQDELSVRRARLG